MYSMGVILLLTVVSVFLTRSQTQPIDKRIIFKKQAGVLAVAGKVIIEQAAKAIADYIAKNIVQHSSFEVIMGRTVIITRNGNSVGIKDVSSGITISGQENTPEEAMMNASKSFVEYLLQNGYISIDDLHLAPVRTTTAEAKKNPNSAFYSFMKNNCYGTCSGCRR